MNLTKLFDMQKALDAHINSEKGLEGQSLLDKKILALQVELGELANEWRGFKFWSEDQEPRTKVPKYPTMNYEDIEWKNPLLEEYVDCLHFTLSIGVDLDFQYSPVPGIYPNNITNLFIEMNYKVSEFYFTIKELGSKNVFIREIYQDLFDCFLVLGKALGFDQKQIEEAYCKKNEINHQRQESGY